MPLRTYVLIFLFLIAITSNSWAATIHGTVYDWSLKRVSNAKVEISTVPKQTVIAENGSYSFNVPIGNYILNGYMVQRNNVLASAQENITIRQDGSYVLDLILFPEIEEGVEAIDLEVDENVAGNQYNLLIFLFGGVGIILIAAAFFYIKKLKTKTKQPEHHETEKKIEHVPDESLEGIIKIIQDEGGRTTQKEIRKKIPLSEAKISLMIAELEHKGKIEKIKKGRGNIIILKK